MGSLGNFPVKNSQSTARLSANSAADPAKTRSTMSPSPQMRRTMESCRAKSATLHLGLGIGETTDVFPDGAGGIQERGERCEIARAGVQAKQVEADSFER